MGELIRAKDWSKTSLGDPAEWPQSLRTMVAVMLDNPFGMYIAWGREYTQLYNDGYRPILGSSKHPQALGISTQETFSEIWHIVKPMFDDVMKGTAVGVTDFMYLLNRNGYEEECFFDFAYSPIRKDNGEVGGVLVTVIETTNRKKADEALKESEARFRAIADDAPVFIFLAGENAAVDYLNKTWREYTGISTEDSKGRAWAEITHPDDVDPATKIYMDGFNNRVSCSFENRQKGTDGIYRNILWKATPRFSSLNGQFIGMMGVGFDIHERKKSEEKLRESEQKVRALVENAPFPIAVYVGKEMIVELANQSIINIWGKGNDVIGKSFKEVLPELDNQSVFEQIQKVLETGESFHTKNTPLDLIIDGKPYTYYFNYSFTPLYDISGNIYGVMNTGVDLTDLNLANKRIEESDKRFRNTMKQAPVGITILRGPEYIVEMANDAYLQLVGRQEAEFIGKPLFTSLPEVEETVHSLLDGVLNTGVPYHGNEVPIPVNRYGKQDVFYFDFLYHPLKEEDGKISGVIVSVTEVTEKVEARKKVEDSEKRFQAAVKAVEGILWTNNARGEMEGEQSGWALLTGQTYEEYQGYGWAKAVHPDDEQPTVDAWNEAVQERKTFIFEHRVKTKDGQWRDFSIRAIPLSNADGTLRQWVGVHTDITDNKEAAKALKVNEERLNIIVEASELGTWELNMKTKEPTYSKRYLEIIGGYKEDIKLTHAQLLQHLHPDDLPLREKAFKDAFDTGYLHYESRLIWNDKSIHWMEGKGKVFYDEENNPEKLIGTVRDITEDKNHEQDLKESEHKFRLLADSMPQHVWTSDPEGNLNYFNQSVFNYSGLTLEQINKDGWIQIVHPDDREENIKQWINSVATGKDFLFEHRFRRHNGEYRWQLSRAIPQRDENGKIQMWVGTSTDIQEQKNFAKELEKQVAERTDELKKSEERFFKIFDSNPVPMSLSEIGNSKIKYANNRFYNSFGYTKEEVIGRSSEDLNLLDPEESKRVVDLIFGYLLESRSIAEVQALSKDEKEALLLKLNQSEKMKDFEILYTRKNGEKFPALVSYEVIRIGTESYTVTSYQDIAERKKAEAILRSQNDQLEKMNKELESFAYVSSHDLQEPLRKIQTFASRIKEKEENNLSDLGKNMFNRMEDAAKRMQTLIQDLLAYSHTNTTERRFVTTDLNEIIAEIKETFKEKLSEKHVTIETNQLCDADIIPFQFRQLMHNLISNSLKFSNPEHPPHIQIKSEIGNGIKFNNEKLSPQNKYCHITVSDNGIGFEQQYSEKIFEVFQRLHSKNEYNGTGIGLSIVKKIVENHHGIITAKGELNKGATFEIYIPAT